VQFSRKVVNQCAEMVAKSPQYAWPLAALVAQVATVAPELPDVLLAVMQVRPPAVLRFTPVYTCWARTVSHRHSICEDVLRHLSIVAIEAKCTPLLIPRHS
jgi:hypothetical protein